MRTLLAAGLLAVVTGLGGCAQPKTLYLWESFPRLQYDTLLAQGAGPEQQLKAMKEQADKARATGAALPPGFRAHMGLLLLNAGDADGARRALEDERAAFPESAGYIDGLLARRKNAPAQKSAIDKGLPA